MPSSLKRSLIILAVLCIGCAAGGTELHDAVKDTNLETVKSIIADRPGLVHEVNESGVTPLHLAAGSGHYDITALLVKAGADVNVACSRGMTPLRWAVYSQQADIARMLLDNGANAQDVHPVYGSLIDQAFSSACQNKKGPELVELLIEQGLEFDGGHVDAMGMSRLDWAAHFGNVALARFALERGADPNVVSRRLGRTPLVAVITGGKEEFVDLLLRFDADVSISDGDGNPPIRYAVEKGRSSILEKLLAKGTSVDFRDPRYGRNLLHMAAINGFADVGGLLVSHGCDVNAMDDAGVTPVSYAARYGNRDIAEFLIEHGATLAEGAISHYEASPHLTRGVPENQAAIWYLNHRGWAVKTASRMLVFDAEEFGVRRPDNPCLANGFLTAGELAEQNVVGFYSCYHGQPGEPAYLHTLADSVSSIAFVHLLDDAWRGSENTAYLSEKADTLVAGIKVRTLATAGYMPVLSYLCESDDITIYYQPFATDNLDKLKQDYAFLEQFADTIDIAFLPIPEEGSEDESDLRLFLDSFPTRLIILVDANRREYLFPPVADKIAAWGVAADVCCAQNPGDNSLFSRGTH